MKKLLIFSVLISLISFFSFSQNPYYDAKKLAERGFVQSNGKISFLVKDSLYISEILVKYDPNQIFYPGLRVTFHQNPFIELPIIKSMSSASPFDISKLSQGLKAFSSVGGLNVTNFADGLAKFLVQRSKEELNVAFFRRFQDYLNDYPEVQIIFPTTYDFLKQIYSYQYAAMLPALKAAFQKDLNAFNTNLLNLRDKSNYVGYGTNKEITERADEIIAFLDSPIGRSVIGALIVSNGIVKGNNAADIISNLASDDICTNHSDENFPNFIQLVDLLSQSLRSNEDGRVWITKQQLTDLVKDEITFKIYLGLIYAVDQKNKHQISFKIDGSSYSFNTFLTEISGDKWNSEGAVKFKASFSLMANSLVEVADNAKNIIDAKKQGDQASILVYADYASSIASLFKQSVNFLSYNPSLNRFAPEMLKFANVIDDAANACYDLKSQNYTALVLHTASVLTEILGSSDEFKIKFIKYGTFMANIVEAKNSDEVQAAIESAVLPVGSSSVKRETDMNISLNAYIGPYVGREFMPTLNVKEDQWAYTAGLTAPVGVAFSWGNKGKRTKKCNGDARGGKSYTLFLPVIDIGSIASFRMGDDSSKVASEITLSNIISPGLYFYYGFGKCPISIGFGGQLGPQLRGVTAKAASLNIDKNYYLRFGFNVVVDIPCFNLYTKN